MSIGSIEAVGDVADGALLARVVEPAAGEGVWSGESDECLNCGAALATRYCGQCGQSAHVHVTLVSIGHDLLHGLFHFEGKIWRTIPDLLIHPGNLTRRYIAGERVKFVSPLATFLFAVFMMFAVFESVGGPFHPHAEVIRNGQRLSEVEVARDLAQARTELASLNSLLAKEPVNSATAETLRGRIAAVRAQTTGLDLADRVNRSDVSAESLAKLRPVTGWETLDRRIGEAATNPELLALKLQANAHKFAWALVPLSVPFLWLVFAWRREYRLYDHTIYIIYALAAAMALLVLMAMVSALGVRTGWALLLIPIHQYRQLRGAYRVTRWGAIWRAAWLQVSAVVVLSCFTVGLLASGFLG